MNACSPASTRRRTNSPPRRAACRVRRSAPPVGRRQPVAVGGDPQPGERVEHDPPGADADPRPCRPARTCGRRMPRRRGGARGPRTRSRAARPLRRRGTRRSRGKRRCGTHVAGLGSAISALHAAPLGATNPTWRRGTGAAAEPSMPAPRRSAPTAGTAGTAPRPARTPGAPGRRARRRRPRGHPPKPAARTWASSAWIASWCAPAGRRTWHRRGRRSRRWPRRPAGSRRRGRARRSRPSGQLASMMKRGPGPRSATRSPGFTNRQVRSDRQPQPMQPSRRSRSRSRTPIWASIRGRHAAARRSQSRLGSACGSRGASPARPRSRRG